MAECIVGEVLNPLDGEYRAVVGFEFEDSPGYYQFYVIGKWGHFRKRVASCDRVDSVKREVARALKAVASD